jgi:hypothetical protein
MSRWQFVFAVILGTICIGLSAAVIVSGKANQDLQLELQAQQIEINKGIHSQQIATNLVRDIAAAAEKNQKLRDLLIREGFTLERNASASPAPSPNSQVTINH